MNRQEIEFYHNRGWMPDKYYNVLIGKDPTQILLEQHKKMYDTYIREQEQQKEIEQAVQAELDQVVSQALEKLFKDFGK